MSVLFRVTKIVIKNAKTAAELDAAAEKVDVLYMADKFSTDEYSELTALIDTCREKFKME